MRQGWRSRTAVYREGGTRTDHQRVESVTGRTMDYSESDGSLGGGELNRGEMWAELCFRSISGSCMQGKKGKLLGGSCNHLVRNNGGLLVEVGVRS